jgi:hypothetical protein
LTGVRLLDHRADHPYGAEAMPAKSTRFGILAAEVII